MNRIEVINHVKAYELDDKEVVTDPPVLRVESHRIYSERVVLVVGGTRYTLVASDLLAAIRNATNAS